MERTEEGMAKAAKEGAKAREGSWLWAHGLGLALGALFLATMIGLVASGWIAENQHREEHDNPPLTVAEYVTSAQFVSATFENWESEFLQMGVFVLLSVWLREKGSAESRPLDPDKEKQPRFAKEKQPWAARQAGAVRWLYENSLSIAFFVLFLVSFVAHLLGSLIQHNEDQLEHGQPTETLSEYLGSAQFWFESMQNWQSEFVSVLAIVMLSVWLRQKDSPQSKPVEAPHEHTGH
jgi:hypothetical protein